MHTDPLEQRGGPGPVAIYLTPDEALVLFDFLHRGQERDDDYSLIEHQAESRVLWDLHALLESWLVDPLLRDYGERLDAAREAVQDPQD